MQMSYLTQLVVKQEDAVCLELYVKEACMPQMILGIATAANHKELLRTSEGIHPSHDFHSSQIYTKTQTHQPFCLSPIESLDASIRLQTSSFEADLCV